MGTYTAIYSTRLCLDKNLVELFKDNEFKSQHHKYLSNYGDIVFKNELLYKEYVGKFYFNSIVIKTQQKHYLMDLYRLVFKHYDDDIIKFLESLLPYLVKTRKKRKFLLTAYHEEGWFYNYYLTNEHKIIKI